MITEDQFVRDAKWKERDLRIIYRLHLANPPRSRQEVATMYGISTGRIRQIDTKARHILSFIGRRVATQWYDTAIPADHPFWKWLWGRESTTDHAAIRMKRECDSWFFRQRRQYFTRTAIESLDELVTAAAEAEKRYKEG